MKRTIFVLIFLMILFVGCSNQVQTSISDTNPNNNVEIKSNFKEKTADITYDNVEITINEVSKITDTYFGNNSYLLVYTIGGSPNKQFEGTDVLSIMSVYDSSGENCVPNFEGNIKNGYANIVVEGETKVYYVWSCKNGNSNELKFVFRKSKKEPWFKEIGDRFTIPVSNAFSEESLKLLDEKILLLKEKDKEKAIKDAEQAKAYLEWENKEKLEAEKLQISFNKNVIDCLEANNEYQYSIEDCIDKAEMDLNLNENYNQYLNMSYKQFETLYEQLTTKKESLLIDMQTEFDTKVQECYVSGEFSNSFESNCNNKIKEDICTNSKYADSCESIEIGEYNILDELDSLLTKCERSEEALTYCIENYEFSSSEANNKESTCKLSTTSNFKYNYCVSIIPNLLK